MIEGPAALLERFRKKGILLDSNLLILLLIGLVEPQLICRHPHTKGFSVGDFELIRDVVSNVDRLVTIPHVLTEVSNLGWKKLSGEYRERFSSHLAWFARLAEEDLSVAAREVVSSDPYATQGLPDAAILAAVERKVLLITKEEALVGVAYHKRCAVLPFYLLKQLDS